jgi:DNA-binding transcriptional regulator GbsR (MarR family)
MEENEIKEKIYSTFANIANSLGYSEVYGRIIACLLINGGAVSLNDISKETGYSSSMVSLSVDFLETIGMIKRVKKPGDKKLYLQSTGTLLDGLKKVILMRIEKNVSNSLQQFDEYRKEIKKLRNKESEKLLKAVEILEKEIKRMNDYINILSKIQLS